MVPRPVELVRTAVREFGTVPNSKWNLTVEDTFQAMAMRR